MGVGYYLVNMTAKEWVTFTHVSASTKRELAGNPASAAITTWYLLTHLGESIAFVSDSNNDWPFMEGSRKDLIHFHDVTDDIIEQLIEEGILIDEGREVLFDNDQDVYIRLLKNIWL